MTIQSQRLDVLNCDESYEKIIEHEVYRCPAIKGSKYDQHKPAKYLGVYKDKRVCFIAEVKAVVDIMEDGSYDIPWIIDIEKKGLSVDEIKNNFFKEGKERLERHGYDHKNNRVFILKDLHNTNFINPSTPWPGHNTVFDVASLKINNSKELAVALDGKSWDEIPKQQKVGRWRLDKNLLYFYIITLFSFRTRNSGIKGGTCEGHSIAKNSIATAYTKKINSGIETIIVKH